MARTFRVHALPGIQREPYRTVKRSPCDHEVPVHQREMLRACEIGNVSRLKELSDAIGLKGANTATERGIDAIDLSGPPATSDLLYAAVSHSQPAIIEYLLKLYPGACVATDVLLASSCAKPDLPTLKVLRSHDPSIVNYAMRYIDSLDYLLIDYCRSGDPRLASFLLDNGANPNIGGPPLPFFHPLPIAICSGQPLWLIGQLIRCGAKVSVGEVTCAIRQQRTDVLEMVLSSCHWIAYEHGPRTNMNEALREARDTKNEDVIKLMKTFIRDERRKKWWHFWN